MSSDQMPAPGKIKLIKFPPPRQEKTSNARRMPGGMFKLRFDRYIYLTIRLRAQVFYEQIVNEAQPSWLSLVENEGE